MAEYLQNTGYNWYKDPSEEVHNDVFSYVNYLDNKQAYRSTDNLRFARLYSNYEIMGIDPYNYFRLETAAQTNHRVTLNVIQSMVDTVVAKIAKNKPKPSFLTDGGDWSLQQKAKKLTKYVEGIFYDTEFYAQATKAFTDACIFGTGCIKIFKRDGEIKAERVFIEEIKIDDVESYYSEIRQIHQVKYIHRDVLKEMFPDFAGKIESAGSHEAAFSSGSYNQEAGAMVRVIESWRVRSSLHSTDGRHCLSISNCTLFDEQYDKDYLPFVFFRWTERPVGFFGQGLSEQLQGTQLEINKILRTIQIAMHLVSVPKLLVEASSKIVTAHLNNKIGGIIKYSGTPPQYAALGGIPPELFSHLDRLYNKAYEISGVSQLSAQSKKPSGLDSGKALREFNDIESERFMATGQRYEQCFVKAAEIMIDMAKDLYEELGSYKIKVKGRKFIETIDWKDVDLEEDKYMMEVFPTSALSSTPAGRLQDVQDLMNLGFLQKEDAMKLLDFPDLEATTRLYNAPSEDIEHMIETMIDKGSYEPPEPYQNLAMGVVKCQQAYLMYKSQNAPEGRLELLRRWIEDANGLISKSQQKEELMQQAAQTMENPAPGETVALENPELPIA